MADMSEEDVNKTKVGAGGWHTCQGCRCFIHTSIICSEVRDGGEEGEYLCGHCHEVAKAAAQLPAARGIHAGIFDSVLVDDDDDDFVDTLTKRHKAGGQQSKPNNKRSQSCTHCTKPGHNKRKCPQLQDSDE